MRRKLDILKCLMLWVILGASSCVMDKADCPVMEDQPTGKHWITLQFIMPASSNVSRANPEGGEDGNGREQGIPNENSLYDVNVFFYVGSGLNPANPDDISVAGVYVADLTGEDVTEEDLPFEKRITIRLNPSAPSLSNNGILEATSEVSFITVINAGADLTDKISTLSELRKFTELGKTWDNPSASTNAADCGHFVMTTAYDADTEGMVEIAGVKRKVGSGRLQKKPAQNEGSDGDEWWGETTVHRMCARIDLMYNDNNKIENSGGDMQLKYPVIVDDKKTNTVLYITHMLPVNIMQQPSYLLKGYSNGIPSSWDKNSLENILWGKIENTKGSYGEPANCVIEPKTHMKEGNVDTETLTSWYANTRTSEVKKLIGTGEQGALSAYYSGRLTQKEDLYDCDNITVLGYANENTQSPNQYNSNYLTGIAFRAIYQPETWYKKTDGTFVSETKGYPEWIAMDDKTFTHYQPTSATGITDNTAKYFYSYADAAEYSRSHPEDQAILTKYDGGVCYYNLWLRHYDDVDDIKSDPHAAYPMQYAVVRNNIYRVALEFSGPGDPTPTMREPETMQARIFVRKWNQRTEKDALLF